MTRRQSGHGGLRSCRLPLHASSRSLPGWCTTPRPPCRRTVTRQNPADGSPSQAALIASRTPQPRTYTANRSDTPGADQHPDHSPRHPYTLPARRPSSERIPCELDVNSPGTTAQRLWSCWSRRSVSALCPGCGSPWCRRAGAGHRPVTDDRCLATPTRWPSGSIERFLAPLPRHAMLGLLAVPPVHRWQSRSATCISKITLCSLRPPKGARQPGSCLALALTELRHQPITRDPDLSAAPSSQSAGRANHRTVACTHAHVTFSSRVIPGRRARVRLDLARRLWWLRFQCQDTEW